MLGKAFGKLRERVASVRRMTEFFQKLGVPSYPVVFLGLAENVMPEHQLAPVGAITLFRLSRAKGHFFYPAPVGTYSWILAVDRATVEKIGGGGFALELRNTATGAQLARAGMTFLNSRPEEPEAPSSTSSPPSPHSSTESKPDQEILDFALPDGQRWVLIPLRIDTVVEEPGQFQVSVRFGNEEVPIGTVNFLYRARAPFTLEELRAIKSDPGAVKYARVILGCKKCDSKYRVYAALDRDPDLERDGHVWQHDVADRFACSCGATSFSLQSVRESLHALLGRDARVTGPGISYARRYGHEEIVKVLDEFRELVRQDCEEEAIQGFIEKHPLLLARFHAQKVLKKPKILGRYAADFGVLDTRGILWLIELERPGIPLFKERRAEEGHPYHDLAHAFDQAKDWLFECHKHRAAVLDGLELKLDEVVDIRAVVIAGRRSDEDHDNIERLLHDLGNKIDFWTYDDLAGSVKRISRDLA